MPYYAITALTAIGTYAFPHFFVLASEYVFHLLLETTMHPCICGTPHVRMKLNLQAFSSRIL